MLAYSGPTQGVTGVIEYREKPTPRNMAPTFKSYEILGIEPIIKDGSVQWSPDNKYICVASTDHIVFAKVNTDMLKTPIPNLFYSSTNIDINKTHGTHLINKFIPLKQIIKSMPMEEINRIVCDVKVGSEDLFVNNADAKKLRWSPCSFKAEQSLLGVLNSLGFLEIIHCHNNRYSKIFQINNLWFSHCVHNYFTRYPLPSSASSLRVVLMNACSLLWIESFAWIPMADRESGLLLVCYHKRGILTVWKIQQTMPECSDPHLDDTFNGCVGADQGVSNGTTTKKSKQQGSKTEDAGRRRTFEHECNLIKVVADYCDEDPFSEENLIRTEFKPRGGDDRVLNIEYIRLNDTRHAVSVSKGDGTLRLLDVDLSEISLDDFPMYSQCFSMNSTVDVAFEQTVDSSMQAEDSLDGTSVLNTSENCEDTREHMDERNDGLEETHHVETEEKSVIEPIVAIDEELSKDKMPRTAGRKRKLSEDDEGNVKVKKMTAQDGTACNQSELFVPTCRDVYGKADRVAIANLVVTTKADSVVLVFNKLSVLHCLVLSRQGELVDKVQYRIKTRTITAIAKFTRSNYLVGTFENKLLVVRINTNDGSVTRNDPDSAGDRVHIKRTIDMTNPTHLINGIVNSANNYLTVLSFKMNVRYETYHASLHPCFLSLTSLHSASSLLTCHVPPAPTIFKQTDLIKCVSLFNMNIVKLNTLCAGTRDTKLKYFLLKLFKPKKVLPRVDQQLDRRLGELENAIYLRYVRRCVKRGLFNADRHVLVLFREWIAHNFPGDCYVKLKSCFPDDPYQESCVLCSAQTRVESMRFALCSAGHRVLRCSLSLVQCLQSYVRCCYCLAYVCTKCTEDPTICCVFCDAKFPL